MKINIDLDLAKKLLKEYQSDNETKKSLPDVELMEIVNDVILRLKDEIQEFKEMIELEIYQDILRTLGEGNEEDFN